MRLFELEPVVAILGTSSPFLLEFFHALVTRALIIWEKLRNKVLVVALVLVRLVGQVGCAGLKVVLAISSLEYFGEFDGWLGAGRVCEGGDRQADL